MPITTFYLDAVEGGTVQKIFLEEGSYVNVGDSILQLDNTDLHLDIMYREAQFFEQINNLRNTRLAMEQNSLTLREQLIEIDYQIQKSKRRYEQSVGLKDRNLISEIEFEQARDDHEYWLRKREITIEGQLQDSILRTIQIEQLEASVARMQANLEVVKKKLENLILSAPVAGHLTSLIAEVGASKGRGQRLGQIDVLDGFKLRAAVDEYYISRINKGQKAEVKISGTDYGLTIKKVYPEVREGRFQIDLEFEETEPEGIRRGQTVQVKLALGDLSEALLLNRGGFYHKTGGNWAYVIDESGDFASKRDIKLGRQNPHVYEVLEGLDAGEKVITSSYDNFGDYDRLVLKNR
jgi:HlyD family secretion protein